MPPVPPVPPVLLRTAATSHATAGASGRYYTFNAFFMTMRGKFTAPGTSIHYYVVEFDPEKLSCGRTLHRPRPAAPRSGSGHSPLRRLHLRAPGCPLDPGGGPSPLECRRAAAAALWRLPPVVDGTAARPSRWEDFRGSVLGPTDPKDAPEGALRGIIAADWKGLGLKAPCNGGDNAVHASASPLEGLAERTNWLGIAVADDPFGKVLLAAGIPEETIKKWSSDPQVERGGGMGLIGRCVDRLGTVDTWLDW